VAVVVFALSSFLLALYPPLGFDETLYHLPFARAFAASGGVPFLPALRFPVFPQLTEVLNAAVLLLAGDVATHLVGWLALAACVALAFGWARELSSPAGGWIAAAMLVGSPLALYLASAGYVEPLLALFGLASLYAADRASRDDDMRGRAAWAIAAGALAGSAAGVKYLGLFFVAAAAVLLIRAKPWREMARDLGGYRLYALYGVAAAAALAPSYARIVAHTGNPLFPFYPEIFGANSWEAQRFVAIRGAGRLLAAATLLWDLTFRRHAVGGMPFVSPAFALGVPVALLGAWREPALRRPLLLSIAYVLAVPLQAHYFLGIAPLWSVVIGAAAATLVERTKLERRVAARALVSIALAFALGGEAYALYRLHRLGMPPADAAGREQLLTAEQPLYSAIAFINRAEGPVTIYGIDAEQMVYYAAGTLLGDHNGPASYALIAARVRARGSVSAALDELGASHLLVPDRPSASFWIEQAAADPRLERIYDDGRATVYRVVPVPRGPVPRLR
jgi:4-amino-4-deoxy-L-arabinose transferase-like glycosyltransferase